MANKSKGFLGDTNIGVFKLGDSDVKLYLGDMLVYPLEEEWDIVATFNVTDTSHDVLLCSNTTSFSAMEIDGVIQPTVVSAYTFSTTGEHTVRYMLLDKTYMGHRPFNDCSALTSIVIPDSVTSIDDYTFYNCTSLTSIDIPSGVTSIGQDVFYGCRSLTSCTIGNGVTTISGQAFFDCSGLTSIVIPSGVTQIADMAFADCSSLTSITCNAMSGPSIRNRTFIGVGSNGTLYVPQGSSNYSTWINGREYYLGYYGWTKVEQ